MPAIRPAASSSIPSRASRPFAVAMLAACAALGFFPPAVRCQTAGSSEMVPRKLLDAILATDFRTGMGSGPPQLQLGSVPPLVSSEIDIPAGTEVLGSLDY